jgi:hypothetical protein
MGSMILERDLAPGMPGCVCLLANLYGPATDEPHPVIMSVTPYGRDNLPDRVANFLMRLPGVKFDKLNCSRLTGFAGVLRQRDAEDYYDLNGATYSCRNAIMGSRRMARRAGM